MAREDRAWQLWRKRDQTQHKCALLLAETVSPQRTWSRGQLRFRFPSLFHCLFDLFAHDSLFRFSFLLAVFFGKLGIRVGHCPYIQVLADAQLTCCRNPLWAIEATDWTHQSRPRLRRAIHRQFRFGAKFVSKLILKCHFERHGHALEIFLRNWLENGGQDHTLNHVTGAMELKGEAIIQYFCFGILALAKLTKR